MRTAVSPLLTAVTVTVVAFTLSACAPDRGPLGQPTPGQTSSSSTEPEATPSATAGEAGSPFSIPCDLLLTDAEVFDFNNNFAFDPEYVPKAGSLAAEAVTLGGTACGWLNLSGGDYIEIAVATPDTATLTSLNDTASAGTPIDGLGESGYFTPNGDYGQLQAFTGQYWVAAQSLYFGEAIETNTLVVQAISQLP
jgi:hypothetical protein